MQFAVESSLDHEARVLVAVVISALAQFGHCAGAGTRAFAFDGTWFATRSATTPKGLHSERRDTLTIDTQGKSTIVYDITLSLRTPHPPAPLHLVQSCYATSIQTSGGSVTIHWSPLTLISPRVEDIPPGLHLTAFAQTITYTLRGKELVILGEKPLVYIRAKLRE